MRSLWLVVALLLLAGCAQSAQEVKSEEYIGESVTVSGTVEQSVKIGDFSGYVLRDESGSVRVSSDSLPAEGERVRVSGTLMRDSLFGYYIAADG